MGDGESIEQVTVKAYLAVDAEIAARRQEISTAMGHLRHIWAVIPEPEFRIVVDQDWTATWKETIQVLELGKRVVIKPTWRTYTPTGDQIVLELDPGLAFGTGLHPTTQLCVAALEELLQPEMQVLDLGTGTGILALIAAKLGCAGVLAVDNDANAIAVALRNAQNNDVAHWVHFLHGSLADVTGVYDLVLANILAPVIIQMAESGLAMRLRPGGTLVVSGVLVEQAPQVTQSLVQVGLSVIEQRQQGDWVGLLAQRPSAD